MHEDETPLRALRRCSMPIADAPGVKRDRSQRTRPALERVRFRASSHVKGREAILGDVADWLESYAELEQLIDGGEDEMARSTIGRLLARGSQSPEAVATHVRTVWHLGVEPVRDICGLLEEHGIKVLLLGRATEAFFGLSVGPVGGGPPVIVNTWERISVERWIFSAAHELGHLVLHLHDGAFDPIGTEDIPDEEREADEFASTLLMPPATFHKEWEETAGHALLDRVLKVKRVFRVSYKTVLLRLISTGEADRTIWRHFQLQHLEHYGHTLRKTDEPHALSETDLTWLRAHEPERLSESDFGGDRLHRLVRRALDDDLISMGRAAELLRLSRDAMRKLARQWHG